MQRYEALASFYSSQITSYESGQNSYCFRFDVYHPSPKIGTPVVFNMKRSVGSRNAVLINAESYRDAKDNTILLFPSFFPLGREGSRALLDIIVISHLIWEWEAGVRALQ